MAAANVTSSLFSIALFIYMARALEPKAFGYVSYALTIVFFLAKFVDLGLSTYGVREVAKDKLRVSEYVSEIVSFRLVIAAFLIIVAMTAALVFHEAGPLRAIVGLTVRVAAPEETMQVAWFLRPTLTRYCLPLSAAAAAMLKPGLVAPLISLQLEPDLTCH